MARVGRPGMTDAQKDEIWRRWRNGGSLSDIGRAVGKFPASIFGLLRLHGGVTPPVRHRAVRALTLAEREEISRGLAAGISLRQIARELHRAASTISREVSRNTDRQRYRENRADETAWDRARRPKPCRLALHGRLRCLVASKLALDWSPEQIAGWLKRTYLDNESLHVSHETIYRTLFIQTRGAEKRAPEALTDPARVASVETQQYPRPAARPNYQWGPDCQSVPGGRGPSRSRALGGRPPGRTRQYPHRDAGRAAFQVYDARESQRQRHQERGDGLSTQVRRLPQRLRQSLTWDRGMELADHKIFTLATDAQVYFCDPKSPWQRGTNEKYQETSFTRVARTSLPIRKPSSIGLQGR